MKTFNFIILLVLAGTTQANSKCTIAYTGPAAVVTVSSDTSLPDCFTYQLGDQDCYNPSSSENVCYLAQDMSAGVYQITRCVDMEDGQP